jgi:hypothetical protein
LFPFLLVSLFILGLLLVFNVLLFDRGLRVMVLGG